MQIIPRYLVNNRTTIIANEAGFITEYRPVYTRQLQIYRGIDNVVEFKVLNADQKPISLDGYTPKFQAFDENRNLIIEHAGEQVYAADGSTPLKGIFKIVVTDNDTINIKQQFLSYSIHLVDASSNNVLTYSDSYFGNQGTIKILNEAYPGPKAAGMVSELRPFGSGEFAYWASEPLDAQPGINGNAALHTAVFYTDGYKGTVVIQATLDNNIDNGNEWADIETVLFSGEETEPTPVNFNGVYSFIRFKATSEPADKIIKILARN